MDFIEISSTHLPRNKTTHRQSPIQSIFTISPNLHVSLPICQFPQEIIRCIYCKSYINCYSEVIKEDFKWRCNHCNRLNTLPFHYSSSPIPSSPNFDIFADENYITRAPMHPFFLFLIDISFPSFSSNFTNLICESLKTVLVSYELDPRTCISFLLFDDCLHFVSLKNSLKLVSVNPGEDPEWVPLPIEEITVNLQENLDSVGQACEDIKKVFGSNGNNFRAAIDAAIEVLKNNGGKIFLFTANNYQDSGHAREMVLTGTVDYQEVVDKMIRFNVSFDVFTTGLGYLGLVNLGQVACKTGGEVYYYKEIDYQIIFQDIYFAVFQPRGWEALMKVRTSNDWRIALIFGHFYMRNEVLIVPCLTNSVYTLEVVPLNEVLSSYLYVQSSILYTTSSGVRMIRVFNCKVVLTDSLKIILEGANTDCLLNFYLKQGTHVMVKRNSLLAGSKYLKLRHDELKSACFSLFDGWPSNLQEFPYKMHCLSYNFLFLNSTLPCIFK